MLTFIERMKCKRALRNIREGLLCLGIDISHLSDEQIQEAVRRMSRAYANAGVTVKQFNEASRRLIEHRRTL